MEVQQSGSLAAAACITAYITEEVRRVPFKFLFGTWVWFNSLVPVALIVHYGARRDIKAAHNIHDIHHDLSYLCLSHSASGSQSRASQIRLHRAVLEGASPRPRINQRLTVGWHRLSFRAQLTAPGHPFRLLHTAAALRLRPLLPIQNALIVPHPSFGREDGFLHLLNQVTQS